MPVTTDMIRAGNPRLDESTAQYLADLWNTAYPHMRAHLTDAITGCRELFDPQRRAERVEKLGLRRITEQSLAEAARNLDHYKITRRELGQLDRGTHRGCGRMTPAFYVLSAASTVQSALRALPIGSPHAGHIYRLAAELCDLETVLRAAIKDEIARPGLSGAGP